MTELDRLRDALTRLMEAQGEALEVCHVALEVGDQERSFEDDEAQAVHEEERIREALEDVQAILNGASGDVGVILGKGGTP